MSRSFVVTYHGGSCELTLESELGIIQIPTDYVCPTDYPSAVKRYPEQSVDAILRSRWFEIPSNLPRIGLKYKVSVYRPVSTEEFISFSAVDLELMALGDFSFGYAGLLEVCRQIPDTLASGLGFVAMNNGILVPGVRRLEDDRLHLRGFERKGGTCHCQTTRFLSFSWAGY